MAGKTFKITPCLCYHANKSSINYLFQFNLFGHPGGHALDHSHHVSGRNDRIDNITKICPANKIPLKNKLNPQVPLKQCACSWQSDIMCLITAQLRLVWWWRGNAKIQGTLMINRPGAWLNQIWIILFVFFHFSFQSSTIFVGWSSVIFTGVEATITSWRSLSVTQYLFIFFPFLMWLKDVMRCPFKENQYCFYGLWAGFWAPSLSIENCRW